MIVAARLYLEFELAQWRRLGRKPILWWRDDDARAPNPALDRLLALAEGLPLSLAITPDGDLEGLARRLSGVRDLTFSQHGVDHRNCRAPGADPNEHALGTPAWLIAERIADGRRRMEMAGLAPRFYTPPWNHIDDVLPQALARAGFCSLSASAAGRTTPGFSRLDSHLDILRWKPAPRFRGDGRVILSLVDRLRDRRRAGDFTKPIGLLTHHLAHDEAAWTFLEGFLTLARSRFAWVSFEAWEARQGSVNALGKRERTYRQAVSEIETVRGGALDAGIEGKGVAPLGSRLG